MKVALAMLVVTTAGCSVLFAPEHYDDEPAEIREEAPSSTEIAKTPSAAKVGVVVTEDAGLDATVSPTTDAGAKPSTDAAAPAEVAPPCDEHYVVCRSTVTSRLYCVHPLRAQMIDGQLVCRYL